MDAITNAADISQPWVKGFMRRLGYHLAGEWHEMPPSDLRDLIAEHANDILDLVHAQDDIDEDRPQAVHLRVVEE